MSRSNVITSPEEDKSSDKSSKDDESCTDDEDDVGRHDDGSCGVGLLQRCSTK